MLGAGVHEGLDQPTVGRLDPRIGGRRVSQCAEDGPVGHVDLGHPLDRRDDVGFRGIALQPAIGHRKEPLAEICDHAQDQVHRVTAQCAQRHG